MTKEVWFKNNKGQKLSGVLHIPKGEGPFPAVMIYMGLSSRLIKASHIIFRKKLVQAGFAIFEFEYSGHGQSQGKFENFTVSQGIHDSKYALEFFKEQKFVDKKRVGLYGSSLGGLVVLYLASQIKKLKALVLIAPATDYPTARRITWGEKKLKQWKEKGWIDYYGFKLSYKFHIDSKKKVGFRVASKIKIPTLIIHGDKDTSIPISLSKKLYKRLKYPKKLIIFKNQGHHLKDRNGLHQLTINWFKRYLQ